MIKIGICGFGTVGQSLVKHLCDHKDLIVNKTSLEFEIAYIADRSIHKKTYPKNINVTTDVMELASPGKVDILVELIGDVELTYPLIKNAIENKIHIITANKALLADKGTELFELAKENDVFFGFEASVAGAIPIIRNLKTCMTNERLTSIHGIINGTCNYILDRMSDSSLDFSNALEEAKELGYAEADPSFDINGMDAAHKISILSSIAYGIRLPLDNIYVDGIEGISLMDIKYAKELGYKIKHVGITGLSDNSIECRVHPVLVPAKDILAQVSGVMNSVILKGDRFGTSMLYGHGAGGSATASAVVSDFLDAINFISKKDLSICNHQNYNTLENLDIKDINDIECPFYLRIFAEDVSGAMAEITNILANHNISIEAVTQHESDRNNTTIPIVMITNSVKGDLINNAIKLMKNLRHVKEEVHFIRVLKSDE
ncbi:MAG: homoserine dehydrogenase [Pseudomonadota bacterium]|nr:homoserine dehydrogenase [Pseudomonadota bacterium]